MPSAMPWCHEASKKRVEGGLCTSQQQRWWHWRTGSYIAESYSAGGHKLGVLLACVCIVAIIVQDLDIKYAMLLSNSPLADM